MWESGFSELKSFVAIHGHSVVSMRSSENTTQCVSGYPLGAWVGAQRSAYRTSTLSRERIARLEALPGWAWNMLSADWESGFSHLVRYIDEVGDAKVPQNFVALDGFRLGLWVTTQRRTQDSLESERKSRLEELQGWSWNRVSEKWAEGFSILQSYVAEYNSPLVPQSFVTDDGYRLGQWVGEQRTNYRKMPFERKQLLEAIEGWAWNANDALWEAGFARFKVFVASTGHAQVAQSYKSSDGYSLGKWVNSQRVQHTRGTLRADRALRLEALDGWVWGKQAISNLISKQDQLSLELQMQQGDTEAQSESSNWVDSSVPPCL